MILYIAKTETKIRNFIEIRKNKINKNLKKEEKHLKKPKKNTQEKNETNFFRA